MNPPEEMPSFPKTVFETVAERQTYYNIAYLMLSFPLGLFYFVYLVTMLSLGFGLAVTVVGLPLIALGGPRSVGYACKITYDAKKAKSTMPK